ncbi:MAG: hypothetical protein WKF84_16095 [Pyrinomonadaceae bacterium]
MKELLPALAERWKPWQRRSRSPLETSEAALRALADEAGVKAGLLINAARTALTGAGGWPLYVRYF